jgi:hypothetical protein
MSYFSHAFKKTFVGTAGFDSTAGLSTTGLAAKEFTFVNPKTWDVPTGLLTINTPTPLVLVAGSFRSSDKIGPFAGGYQESVKSKTINPKYVSSVYRVDPNIASQCQITVGNADLTEASGLECKKEFLCGNNYNLRVDVKGSPVLRTLTHNGYLTVTAYTGCCADPATVEAVDPAMVYNQWGAYINEHPIMSKFIQATLAVSTTSGATWSYSTPNANYGNAFPANATNDAYRVGLVLTGAYVDTQFADCTFYPTDSMISRLEPLKIYASEVDLNGDPCVFSGVCVNTACPGYQMNGSGETIIRDVIMTEAYMQQPLYTGMDLRIREITGGQAGQNADVFSAIDRNTLYTTYYIQHNVPRFNNPTSTFDNDQYLLQIVTNGSDGDLEDFLMAWLDAANNSEAYDNGTGGFKVYAFGSSTTCVDLLD